MDCGERDLPLQPARQGSCSLNHDPPIVGESLDTAKVTAKVRDHRREHLDLRIDAAGSTHAAWTGLIPPSAQELFTA